MFDRETSLQKIRLKKGKYFILNIFRNTCHAIDPHIVMSESHAKYLSEHPENLLATSLLVHEEAHLKDSRNRGSLDGICFTR